MYKSLFYLKYILFSCLCIFASQIWAVNVHIVSTGTCTYYSGIVVQVDENHMHLLQLNGEIVAINNRAITKVLTTSVADNPLPTINLTADFVKYVQKVYIRNGNSYIYAVAYQFVADMVFLYDLEGNTHVINYNSIEHISDYVFNTTEQDNIQFKKYKPINLPLKRYFNDCDDNLADLGNTVNISTILNDRMKISSFLDSLKQGYYKLLDLKERMRFYPVPSLYMNDFRLGLGYGMYLKWSGGTPYSSQSLTAINLLGSQSQHLPLVGVNENNNFSIQTAFKTHFFHGYFEGNFHSLFDTSMADVSSKFESISAGGITNLLSAVKTRSNELKNNDLDFAAETNYNHLLMMGVDYGNFSVSLGKAYISTQYYFKDETRSLPSTEPYEIIKFSYITDQYDLELLLSLPASNNNISNSEIEGHSIIDNNYSASSCIAETNSVYGVAAVCEEPYDYTRDNYREASPIESEVDNKFSYWRANVAYKINQANTVGGSILSTAHTYKETVQTYQISSVYQIDGFGKRNLYEVFNNKFNADSTSFLIYYHSDFSDYIGIKIFYESITHKYSSHFLGKDDGDKVVDAKWGGYFEFIF